MSGFLLGFTLSAQDSHVQGDLKVDGVARIDGGTDLVGEGLAVYPDATTYEGGGSPVLEISSEGVITSTQPAGDIAMGTFSMALDLSKLIVSPYDSGGAGQDGQFGQPNSITFDQAGREVKIGSNSWKKLFYSYSVITSTVLTFEFLSDDEGEIFAIGLDTDGDVQTVPNPSCFLIGGDQSISSTAAHLDQSYRNYVVGVDGWKRYSIPVGQYFTGQISYITLICDEDRVGQTAEARFRNIVISD